MATWHQRLRIHPSVDHGVKPGRADFGGGTLTCKCAHDPVKVDHQGQCRA